jgi:hypothetical protein
MVAVDVVDADPGRLVIRKCVVPPIALTLAKMNVRTTGVAESAPASSQMNNVFKVPAKLQSARPTVPGLASRIRRVANAPVTVANVSLVNA